MEIKETVWAVPETYNYAIKDREIIECIIVGINENKVVEFNGKNIEKIEDLEEREKIEYSNNTYKLLAKEHPKIKGREFWLYSCKEEHIFKNRESAEKYFQGLNKKRDIDRDNAIENIKTTMKYIFDIMDDLRNKSSKDYGLDINITNPSLTIKYGDETEYFNADNRYD